jgi:uncharacterized linocin/CFP29 family protein
VQEAVRDEAKKQRVAASFLPLYGPLPEDAQSVPEQKLRYLDATQRSVAPVNCLQVDDFETQRLTTLSVSVVLRSAQVAQADLSSAIVAFRRAANLIARAEDYLVFRGQPGENAPLPTLHPCIATGGEFFEGLLQLQQSPTDPKPRKPQKVTIPRDISGPQLVTTVEEAAGILEKDGHLGPFALILNTPLFTVAYTPNKDSLVLPADRIKPLLDGPLLRSSVLNLSGTHSPPKGIMVSLADDLIDLVVASEICVRFIQITAEESPRNVYRVSERFTLRVKQPRAIVQLG